jgi:hypothetical protein
MLLLGNFVQAEILTSHLEDVFLVTEPSLFWQREYAAIKGNSFTEKEQSANNTIQAKAMQGMKLYQKEQELAHVGMMLWKSLPEELSGLEDRPRERFLQAHLAWRQYIKQQAQFLANTSGGGSMYSLLVSGVLIDEIDWRIQLYQKLLTGKNIVKHELYFYACDPN